MIDEHVYNLDEIMKKIGEPKANTSRGTIEFYSLNDAGIN